MAGNSFNDFSSLKSLKKEHDTVYAISCSWNPYGDGATAVTIK